MDTGLLKEGGRANAFVHRGMQISASGGAGATHPQNPEYVKVVNGFVDANYLISRPLTHH